MALDWSKLTPDQAAAVQAAIAKTQVGGSAPSAPVSKDQALQLLVDAYNQSGGQVTPYIQNFGAQNGITLDDIKATSDARHKQYSGGMDVIDWTKDVAGLVGVVGGASALAGALGGAGGATAGAGAGTGGAGAAATTTPYVAPGASITGSALGPEAATAGAGTGAGAQTAGGASHWLKLGNQLRGLLPQPRRPQQQQQMAYQLQSSDPTRSALVQQLLARALRNG
jgi:hypothetical protein